MMVLPSTSDGAVATTIVYAFRIAVPTIPPGGAAGVVVTLDGLHVSDGIIVATTVRTIAMLRTAHRLSSAR